MNVVTDAQIRAHHRTTNLNHTPAPIFGQDLPFHLERLAKARGGDGPAPSIPFYSLCRGLFLPLSGMAPDKAAHLFGLQVPPSPTGPTREARATQFFALDLGLSPLQKTACLLGDPFMGRSPGLARLSLIQLLASLTFLTHNQLRGQLAAVGDPAVLFALSRRPLKSNPPLTAAEVMDALALIPELGRNHALELLRGLLDRCGKLEAYVLTRLVLRKSGLGSHTDGAFLTRILAAHFNAEPDAVRHAVALTDLFEVTRVLAQSGAAGLRRISLKPLAAVRPCLASPGGETLTTFPVWVECKYDGIRLMLHRQTQRDGHTHCAAFSRNRRDYLEHVPALAPAIRAIPAADLIMDGELHGSVPALDGPRPATVYEIMSTLNGGGNGTVTLHYAAFDLLYLNGADLTQLPLHQRRTQLLTLLRPLQGRPAAIPITPAEGQTAQSRNDLNRIYQHYRARGYEGFVAKHPNAVYRLDHRDTHWRKRKPRVTLDLVLLGAFLSTHPQTAGAGFGSYVLGAGDGKGGFDQVGEVGGLDQASNQHIQQRILAEGVWTGEPMTGNGDGGYRSGFALRPLLVVTVRFEGIIRDAVTDRLSLRNPVFEVLRWDKPALEADTTARLKQLYLQQRLG